jgi:hypothetical protein
VPLVFTTSISAQQKPSPFANSPQQDNSSIEWRPGLGGGVRSGTPTNPTTQPHAPTPTPRSPPKGKDGVAIDLSKLSLSFAAKPFTLSQTCKPGTPLVILNTVVKNSGTVAVVTPGHAFKLMAQDSAKVAWIGFASLPAIPAGGSAAIAVPMYPPSFISSATGTHQFTVFLGSTQTPTPVSVNIPASACDGMIKRYNAAMALSSAQLAKSKLSAGTGSATPRNSAPSGTVKAFTTGAPTAFNGPGVTGGFNPSGITGHTTTAVLPVPSGFNYTVDLQECTRHGGLGGGLACSALLPKGRMALVWNPVSDNVDGYNIYRVDNGQHIKVGRQANGKDVTVYIVDPVPQDGYQGKCYAVTSYKGTNESSASQAYCANGGSTVQTVTLLPGQIRSITHLKTVTPGGNRETEADPGVFSVGYYSRNETHWIGDISVNSYTLSALWFDSAVFANKTVRTAKLRLTVSDTTLTDRVDSRTSCVTKIGFGLEEWWGKSRWIDDTEGVVSGVYIGPTVALDVTPIVQRWARAPYDNYGMVLHGEFENPNRFTNDKCYTVYDPTRIQLVVEYN